MDPLIQFDSGLRWQDIARPGQVAHVARRRLHAQRPGAASPSPRA